MDAGYGVDHAMLTKNVENAKRKFLADYNFRHSLEELELL